MNYKHHRIEVSVRSVSDGSGWTSEIYVTYSKNGKNVLKSLRIDRTFATPKEAEYGAVEYVKNGSMTGSRTNAYDAPINRTKRWMS
jgi:hypothetical protein